MSFSFSGELISCGQRCRGINSHLQSHLCRAVLTAMTVLFSEPPPLRELTLHPSCHTDLANSLTSHLFLGKMRLDFVLTWGIWKYILFGVYVGTFEKQLWFSLSSLHFSSMVLFCSFLSKPWDVQSSFCSTSNPWRRDHSWCKHIRKAMLGQIKGLSSLVHFLSWLPLSRARGHSCLLLFVPSIW